MGILTACLLAGATGYSSAGASSENTSFEEGLAVFKSAHYDQALSVFSELHRRYEARHDRAGQVSALLGLAAAYQSLGQYCSATTCLERGLSLAEATGSQRLKMQVQSALGGLYMFSRRLEPAEALLRSSLAHARELSDKPAIATVLQNLGTLLMMKEDQPARVYQRSSRGVILLSEAPGTSMFSTEEGLKCYDESAAIAVELVDRVLLTRILLNKGRALLLEGNHLAAGTNAMAAWQELARQPNQGEKGFLMVSCGHLLSELSELNVDDRQPLVNQAVEAYEAAIRLATGLSDDCAATYAYGFLGELYLKENRFDEAMTLTQFAIDHAQKVGRSEALFQWEWQNARALRAKGEFDKAIEQYQHALRMLNTLRSDFSIGLAMLGGHQSFRETVGQAYFELADLLLRRAERPTSERARLQDLTEARNTVEMLKSVEIEDYFFENECVNLMRTKVRSVDTVIHRTAVVYYVPLPDRTEILLTLPSGLKRVTVPISSTALTEEIHSLRRQLDNPDSVDYQAGTRKLYDRLIRPIDRLLQAEELDTLVFIPDGSLRTIPFAALHDGQSYVVERFAVAVSPGLSLMEPREMKRGEIRALVCGISDAVQGYPQLENVPAEVDSIVSLFGGKKLINRRFSLESFQRQMSGTPFSVVHLASHGEFGSDVSKTFILAYDGKLTLDKLEQLILPHMLSERPIELLTLSACQTAAGDDRSALGLAGVAVKSGARSALATLWYVSDEAAQRLMTDFYMNLKHSPNTSKAAALRQAQCALMRTDRFQHPCFWSPYILIGNWL